MSPVGHSGSGRLFKVGRLNILQLEGEPFAVGLQHGTLLKAEIASGCAPVFGGQQGFEELFSNMPDAEAAFARRLVDGLYAELERGLDEGLKAELSGVERGADIPFQVLLRATFRSEILQVLVAMGAVSGPHRPPGECTALIATPNRARDGLLLHGKNQDYDGAGLWDAVPTVAVVRTTGELPHVRVGTAGLLKASFGMNAAGLTVGGHLLFSRFAQPDGTGFTAFEHMLLKRADSLATAEDIVASKTRWGAFAFAVSDSNDARVFECDNQGVFVRSPHDGLLACANHFVAPETPEARDLLLSGGAGRNSVARYERARVAVGSEAVDPARMAEVLADRFDPCCGAVRSLGQTIAGPLTVMSAVAEPVSRRLWVSDGEAPTCDGPYVGLELNEAFDGGPIRLTAPLGPSPFAASGRRDALRASMSARRALEAGSSEGPRLAERALEQAIALDQADSAHRRIHARLLIRMQRFEAALDALDMPTDVSQSANEQAEAAYLTALALDCLGHRREAVMRLNGIIESEAQDGALTRLSPSLIALARHHLTKAFDVADARRLPMAFTLHSGVE